MNNNERVQWIFNVSFIKSISRLISCQLFHCGGYWTEENYINSGSFCVFSIRLCCYNIPSLLVPTDHGYNGCHGRGKTVSILRYCLVNLECAVSFSGYNTTLNNIQALQCRDEIFMCYIDVIDRLQNCFKKEYGLNWTVDKSNQIIYFPLDFSAKEKFTFICTCIG